MPKKYVLLVMLVAMIFSFSACTGSPAPEEVEFTKVPSVAEIVDESQLAVAEVVSWRMRISADPPQYQLEKIEWEIMANEGESHYIAVMTDGRRQEGYIWGGHYRCDRWNKGSWEITAPLAKGSGRSEQELLFEQIFGGAENLALVGAETVQGKACYILEYTRPAGEYGDRHWPSDHTIKVWIDATSYLPLKETMEWEETTTTIEYYDYNASISIEMPVAAPAPELTPAVPSTELTIKVKRQAHGSGQIETLDLESEYLPFVVTSENAAASYESLKAQAVASRSFALYKKQVDPRDASYDLLDSEADQVYNPSVTVTQQHRQAVKDTEGIILKYGRKVICAFYVSGTGTTEKYVTYNEGKSGDDITQTSLGWVTSPPSKNPYNRGCMGQIQANELASKGYTWQQILRYFYGSDIDLGTAE